MHTQFSLKTCTFASVHPSPCRESHLRRFWPFVALCSLKAAEAENSHSHTLKLMRVVAALREQSELVFLSHPLDINRPERPEGLKALLSSAPIAALWTQPHRPAHTDRVEVFFLSSLTLLWSIPERGASSQRALLEKQV